VSSAIERPRVLAGDPAYETLFAARAALKRALAMRRDVEVQVEQLRALVARLEADAGVRTRLV
jgi:hypothetical protein